MTRNIQFLVGLFLCGLVLNFTFGESTAKSDGANSISSDLIDPILGDAEKVLQDLIDGKAMIASLQEKIKALQTDSQSSMDVLKSQKDLLQSYQTKVEVLEKHYGTVLTLAQRLKQEGETARTVAFIAVPVGVVAIIVAVLEGVAVAQK